MENNQSPFKVLTIDIGGTHIKATILNQAGKELEAYKSLKTPEPASPKNVLKTISLLAKDFNSYDYISAGFPGFIKSGVIQTAPNLGTELWKGINFQKMLQDQLNKPALVVNDADLQGVGVVSGKGFEILVTLGTGFGTAFLKNGVLFPHIELAHHPIKKNVDYDQYIGNDTLKKIGPEKWNTRIKAVIEILKIVFNYDRLYISGGNARLIDFKLEDNIQMVTNEDGIKGGAKLWVIQNETKIGSQSLNSIKRG